MFSLVNKGVGYENMVGSSTTFSGCSLKGVGNIGVLHKLHEADFEGACEELP